VTGVLLAAACIGHPIRALAEDLQEISREGETAILTAPLVRANAVRHPTVTIVEYFDYNCPYCRRLHPTLKKLIADDDKVALVYKDWPVLGDVSTYAARCALAAQWQGRYPNAHDALLGGPRLSTDATVDALLGGAGIDLGRLKHDLAAHSRDIDASLARNAREATALQLDGTPGILVGRLLMPGGAELPYFLELIRRVRAPGP